MAKKELLTGVTHSRYRPSGTHFGGGGYGWRAGESQLGHRRSSVEERQQAWWRWVGVGDLSGLFQP